MLRLIDAYQDIEYKRVLFDLLVARRDEQNISHRKMPTFAEHCAFVDSRPYQHWYLIEGATEAATERAGIVSVYTYPPRYIGAIYLKEPMGQIGIHMFDENDDKRRDKAIRELMRLHPRPRYVANVSVNDKSLRADIENLGFKHIQETFELIP